VHELIRRHVPPYDKDRRHDHDIEALRNLIDSGQIAGRLPDSAWQTPW